MSTSSEPNQMLLTFGQKLGAARKKAGLSQSDLARLVWGTTVDTRGYTVAKNRDLISRYEKDAFAPEPGTIERLAAALNMKADDFTPPVPRGAEPFFSMYEVEGDPESVILQLRMSRRMSAKKAQMIKAMFEGVDDAAV